MAGPNILKDLTLIVALAWPAAAASQQRPVTKDSQSISLTTTDRIDLVNSVLAERANLMGGRALVDACALAKSLQVTGDVSAVLLEQFRESLRGVQSQNCSDYTVPAEPGLVQVSFDTIRLERGEYVMSDPRGKRPSNLVVVPLRIHSPSGRDRREEWVMLRVRPAVWEVLTIRVFAFFWH